MAGVLDKYIAGSSTGQSAAASSGGVFGTVEHKGVLSEYIDQNRPSDPIYDQWKLEQQLKEQMRQRRAQEAAAAEVAAKAVFAPQTPVEPKTKEELRTGRKAAMETAREERRQARAEAGEAYATAEDPVAALPAYKKALADANAAFEAAKTAAWEPANRQAAPERYDPYVQNAGQAKAEWYDPAVIAKGEQAKGNPLYEDARKKLAGGGMGNVNAAMEEMRAIDALTEDQKAYINYVYGKYDKKLAGQLADTLLQNVLNTLNAADERQKTQNVITAVGGQVLAAPVYAAEMVGQAVQNLATGANLPVADYTPGSRMMSEQAARTQDLVDDRETEAGKFLTGVGLSAGQNVLNMVGFGNWAPVMMAIQSAGSGGYEAAQNGATGWQQLGKGAQSGVTELLTEKISWGKLEEVLEGMPTKTAKGIIAKIAGQMATEAGEETAGEAVSMLYDWIAMGDAGDLKQTMEEYKAKNGDEGAAGYLALQILQRLGESALAGAISGGVLGGGATAINAVQNRNTENAAKTSAPAVDLPQETPRAAGNDAAQVRTQAAQEGVERGQENAQGPVADFSETEANQAPAVENTQNAVEKKPPVDWEKRNIDAEDDPAAVQQAAEQAAINDNGAEQKQEQPQSSEEGEKAVNNNGVQNQDQQPARPENKRTAESRARDAARELHVGKAGEEKILQTIRQMDEANMTPEMRQTVAQTVAEELVKEGPYISKEFWDSFAPLREYLRKTEMHIDPQTLGEIKAMGLSVTGFNQKYGTKLTTKQMKRSLDGNIAEWAALTNGLAQESDGNAFDALVHTLEVMRQGKAGELDAPGYEAALQGAAETLLKYADETMEPDELEAWDKKHGLQSTASQVTEAAPESNGSENPNKSGWEKFKENRIAQAMQRKPEGAVARMDAADGVRKAEEEIAKAKERLEGLKGNAEPGEIDEAESIAKGHKTLQQVSADFSKEKVALMAEQMRLIKQWEEQGIVGQKKRLHSEQFEAAEKLLEGADDAIFEHDAEGAKKLISKRKGELFRMLSSTSERVMRQVFDKKTAQRAIEEYIRPAERNEAAKIMAISRLFDGARELKLNRYESTMVQLVGEGLVPAWSKAGTNPLWHNGQALVESLPEYARANPEIQKLAENLGEIDAQKITKAVTWYRKTYDDFHALVNDFRLAHGMPEIGNIEQYFPHFSQDMDGDMLNQTLKAFGIEQMSSLPASIAGMTQGFRPFSRWVGSFQKRTGPQTVFDAEQGFQMYANAVMDMLYHTDDIMRIRHLETMIRRRSKEAGETGKRPGTKERLEAMKQTMENPEQLKKLEEDMELGERDGSGKDISGEYSGFVQWLREYGNKLAGKGDTYRLSEPVAGRQAANVINKLLGNYGTAQIVGNLRSAIANTAVLPKMLALLGTQKGSALKPEIYIGQALGKMARGEMASLYGKSEFMTSKQGVEPLVKTKKDKAADVMMKFFNVVEDAMSKLAFTAGYVQAEDQLKDSKLNAQELEREAIQRANDFAANIMARRDKAGSALLGRSREPLLRLVGMFQTEISNEWQTLRQDLPREYEELERQIGKKKARATYAAALARYVVYSHVLGFAAEAVFGINPFNDVWAWIVDFGRNIWEEPEEEDEKGKLNFGAVKDLAGEVAGSVPYLSTIAALAGYTNDRLPLFNAKEFAEDLGSIVTAERFSGRVEGVANVAGSVGQLLGVPGTGQGVKTVKGAVALLDQGKRSQKTGQLQDVWQWDGGKGVWDAARAVAFGPSAMKGMREYYDSGYRAELTTAQTRAYDAAIGAGVPKDKALEYVKWSKDVKVEKDEKGNTVPHSRNVKFLARAESIEGLTAEQQAILYQGALPSDQAEEFEKMSQTVKNMGIDTETWLEFLRRYYQINGSGKKDKVKKLMAVLSIPPVWQKDLAKVVGYEL